MIKRLDGVYEPSKRSDLWVKLKKDYVKGLQVGVRVAAVKSPGID